MLFGNTILLTCVATGSDSLSINWTKGDVVLSNDSSRIRIFTNELEVEGVMFLMSVLEICGLEFADSGMYSCLAIAPESIDRDNFTITVTGQPPELVITSEDVNVTFGSSVFLTCVAYGIPTPTFAWQRTIGMVDMDVENTTSAQIINEIVEVDGNQFAQSTLLLCASELNTTAVYTCIASNTIGSVNDSFTIRVEETEGMSTASSLQDFRLVHV